MAQQLKSQQIMGGDQQNPQTKQSYFIGKDNQEICFNIFDDIIKYGLQKTIDEDSESFPQQLLLNQFKCMIVSHENNEVCKAQNRQACYDCLINGIHNEDVDVQKQQLQFNQLLNESQLNDAIIRYKLYLNERIDQFEYFLYLEQLELINQNNQKISCIKHKALEKTNNQIQYLSEIKDQINLKEYIQQQYEKNMGLIQYISQYQNEITEINENIVRYNKLKGEIMNDSNLMKNVKININFNDLEGLDQLKKKKQTIIHKIIQTSQYKNLEIDEKYKILMQSQISQTCQLDNEFYILGISLYNQERYEEAIQMIEKAIQINPQKSYYYIEKGNSLSNLKRYDEAIQMYDKAIQLNPKDPSYYNNKGYSLQTIKSYEEAIQMYDEAIKFDPQNSNFYNNKGTSFHNLSKYEEAIQVYDKAIQLNPQNSNYYNNKGSSLYNLQRYEEAIQVYDKAIQLNPQNSNYYNNKGSSLYNLQRYEEAIEMYDKAIQFNPKDSIYYNSKGISLDNLNRYEEAIQMYDKALQLNPKNDTYYNDKGNSLNNLQRYEEAIQMYDQAIKLNPYYSYYYNNKGDTLRKIQKYDEAIQMYDKALQINPSESLYYFNKGDTLRNLKKYEEAIKMYDKAIKFNSQNSNYYNNKGITLHMLHRYRDAIEMYDKAIKLNPQNSNYYNNKGTSLHKLFEFEQAIEAYDKAIQYNPQHSNFYNNKGSSLHNLQRYEEAIEMYDKAIQFNPQNSNYHLNRGQIYQYDSEISLQRLQNQQNPIKTYKVTIPIDPKQIMSSYYEFIESSSHKLQKNKGAIINNDKSLLLNPQNSDNQKNKILFHSLQRSDDAIQLDDNSKQLNSQISDNSISIGNIDQKAIQIEQDNQFSQKVLEQNAIKMDQKTVIFNSIQLEAYSIAESQNQEYPFQELIKFYNNEDFQRKLKQVINDDKEAKLQLQYISIEQIQKENLQIENDIIFSAAISYDDKYLGFCSYSGQLQLFDIKEKICYQLDRSKSSTVCVFKPNSHSLISGSHDGWIFCFDGSNQFVIKYQTKIHNDAINCIKFVNKSIIITCSNDNNIIITDLENKQQQQKIANAHDHYIMSIDYNQTIQIMASCSLDRSIKIWSLSGKLIDTVYKAHKDFIMQIQIVESKRLLLSLCSKGQLKLWEFSQQGKIVFRSLIGSNDKIFYFYYVEESSNLIFACENNLQIINFELRSIKITNHISNYVDGQITQANPQNVFIIKGKDVITIMRKIL